jgi:hypothetical protein
MIIGKKTGKKETISFTYLQERKKKKTKPAFSSHEKV